jgi:predicted nucleotidyltransferase
MQEHIASRKSDASSKMPLRSLDHPPIDEALIQEITRRIVEGVHPRKVVLFGSHARGNFRRDSDLDIMVEMDSDETKMERKKRIRSLFRDRWWSMDILVYTPAEIAAQRNSLFSIIPVIVEEGRVLYERTHRS